MYLARKHYLGTLFIRHLLEMGPHFTWSSEPSEGLAVCTAKAVPSFLSYLRTLSIGPAQEIEPATSRIVVKRSSAD